MLVHRAPPLLRGRLVLLRWRTVGFVCFLRRDTPGGFTLDGGRHSGHSNTGGGDNTSDTFGLVALAATGRIGVGSRYRSPPGLSSRCAIRGWPPRVHGAFNPRYSLGQDVNVGTDGGCLGMQIAAPLDHLAPAPPLGRRSLPGLRAVSSLGLPLFAVAAAGLPAAVIGTRQASRRSVWLSRRRATGESAPIARSLRPICPQPPGSWVT